MTEQVKACSSSRNAAWPPRRPPPRGGRRGRTTCRRPFQASSGLVVGAVGGEVWAWAWRRRQEILEEQRLRQLGRRGGKNCFLEQIWQPLNLPTFQRSCQRRLDSVAARWGLLTLTSECVVACPSLAVGPQGPSLRSFALQSGILARLSIQAQLTAHSRFLVRQQHSGAARPPPLLHHQQ